jgi:hypothetical protein
MNIKMIIVQRAIREFFAALARRVIQNYLEQENAAYVPPPQPISSY